MKDNILRELTLKQLIRKEVSDFYINILGYCVEPEDEYTVELATKALETLLDKEIRKAIIGELKKIYNSQFEDDCYGGEWGDKIFDRIKQLEKE